MECVGTSDLEGNTASSKKLRLPSIRATYGEYMVPPSERKWLAQPLLAMEVTEKEGQEVAVGMGPMEKPSQLPFQGRL